jgi:hypothetical protein
MPHPRCIDHDRVLNLWRDGLKAREIPPHVGAGTPSTVLNLVVRYRQKGDPRAVPRAWLDRCKRGHPFDEQNTGWWKDGKRRCRQCHRMRYVPRSQRTVAA